MTAPPTIGKSVKPRIKIIAAIVALALLVGGVLWWRSSRDDSTTEQRRVSIGNGLFASGGDATKLVAKPAKVKAEQLAQKWLTKPYDVQVKGGGNLTSPVTLWLPTTAKPGDLAMLASKHPGKAWDYFGPGRGDVRVVAIDGRNYLRATVPHLSIDIGFSPVDWMRDQWRAALSKATANLYVDTSVPKCRDQATAGKLRYGLGVAQKGAITACVGYYENAAELIVKNIKRYPLVVHHKGLKRTKSPTSQLSAAALTKLDDANETTLMSGDTVTLSKALQPGQHATVTTEYNGWTQNMYRVDVAIHAIVQMYEIMRGGKVNYNDIASLVLQSADCTNAIAKATVTDLMSSCFPPQLMEKVAKMGGGVANRTAVVEEFGNGLSTWLVSEASSVLDIAKGNDRAELWLNRHVAPAPGYKLPHTCADYGHGDAIVITKGSVGCAEAIAVGLSYGRDGGNPRYIDAAACAVAHGSKSACTAVTGKWYCYGGEGLTGCKKGDSVIERGIDFLSTFVGTWHTHDMTISIKTAGSGTVEWREEAKSYKATFTYGTTNAVGMATITSSTKQTRGTGYYAFKVGDTYRMTLSEGNTMLTMVNTSDPGDSIAGCGKGVDCGA